MATDAENTPLIGVIDAGTNTVQFCVFPSQHNQEIAAHAVDIKVHSPLEGWYEEDPNEILEAVKTCIKSVTNALGKEKTARIVTIGITNQRETTVVWDKTTGAPLHNAIVWNDIRTDSTVDIILAKVPENNKNYYKKLCGLPISPYFSAFKLKWMMKFAPRVEKAIKEKKCLFGTIDTWILWNLTGGPKGGVHVTDVTNASRTFLMNIDTFQWEPILLDVFRIPEHILPQIRSCSEVYGKISDDSFILKNIPISGILGNQQSALVGQHCFAKGQAKNTYRRGCFLLYNTGIKVHSTHGLVTTVAYKFGDQPAVYALEGSVAVAGSAMRWLKDNMGFIKDAHETETLAKEVFSTGDVYFVPAFNGLYAPYWRKDARGIICGLTAFSTKHHIVRAALEAVCFQTRDILEAMKRDCGIPLTQLNVDGEMTKNSLLMQLQADLCGIPVIRARSQDITALGAAIAAGSARGIDVWDVRVKEMEEIQSDTFRPTTTTTERDARYTKWKMAVQRSLGWAVPKNTRNMTEEKYRLLSSIPGSWFIISTFALLAVSEYFGYKYLKTEL